MQSNLNTVHHIFSCFAQGNIPGIIANLADNVYWTHPGKVAFSGTYNGLAGAGQFFERVGATVQVTAFVPGNFSENGNVVSNSVHMEGHSVATGKPYSYDFDVKWTFDSDGKVTRSEAAGDTSGLEAALSR